MGKIDYLIKFDEEGNRGETHDAVFMTAEEIADYQAKGFIAVSTADYNNLLGNNADHHSISAKATGRMYRSQPMCRQQRKNKLRSCPNWTTIMPPSWKITKTLSL